MTRKHRIRIGIIIAIICMMSFSDRSFAEETSNKDIEFLGRSLNIIVGRMSWLWIFFAKIAGQLLTNKWVYGETLGLDALLRKYWNVCKNLANFGLGFYFIFVVFRGLVSSGKDSIEKTLKNTLLWLLVAGIGIQASWFLTATVIDVSSIAVSAAGSFPSVIMSKSPYIESEVKESIRKAFEMEGDQLTKGKLIKVGEEIKKTQFVDFMNNYVELEEPKSMTELVDILQPQPADVSGPLYFIGFSILDIKEITSINSTNTAGREATLFNTIIQGGTTLIYGIEMLVLCIVAIIRIIYLWMFIIVSPIAILLWCIKESGEKIGGSSDGFLSRFMVQINFETFFINVFKPAIVVLGLGVAAIFAGLMSNIVTSLSKEPFSYKGVTYSSIEDNNKNTGDAGDVTYTSSMDHNLFKVTLLNAGKTFLELILSILTVILVYQIIKIAMTMGNGKDFLGKRIDSIQGSVGNLLGSVPIVPVAGYDKEGVPTTNYIGANRVFGLGGKESLLDTKINDYESKIRVVNQEDEKTIESWFNKDTPGILSAEKEKEINNTMRNKINPERNLRTIKEKIENIRDDKGKGFTLKEDKNNIRRREFEGWLTLMKDQEDKINSSAGFSTSDVSTWKRMVRRWNDEKNKDNRTLEKMFRESGDESTNVKAYVRFFLGDSATTNTTQRKDLETLDISKKDSDGESSSDGNSGDTAESGEGKGGGENTPSAQS